MIQKIQQYKYKCDFCQKEEIFYNGYLNHIESARKKGWAIGRNRLQCYCPNCAISFRNTGKQTARTMWEKRQKEKEGINNGKSN